MDESQELPPLSWGIMGAGRVCHDFVQVTGIVQVTANNGRRIYSLDKSHNNVYALLAVLSLTRDGSRTPASLQALKSVPHAAKVQTVGCRELERSIEFAHQHGETLTANPACIRRFH